MIPDPCPTKHRHVEPSSEYLRPSPPNVPITSGTAVVTTRPLCAGECQPEPIDVPAIQKKARYSAKQPDDKYYMKGFSEGCADLGGKVSAGDCEYPKHTCADAHRVLEHTEAGEYYCRKVQP